MVRIGLRQQGTQKKPRDHELRGGRDAARAVEAGDPVTREELPAAGPREPDDVLEIRCGGRDRADRRWVEEPAPERECERAADPALRLEAPRGDVLVRDPVAGGMKGKPGDNGSEPGAQPGPGDRTGGDMHRDDHGQPSRTSQSMHMFQPYHVRG